MVLDNHSLFPTLLLTLTLTRMCSECALPCILPLESSDDYAKIYELPTEGVKILILWETRSINYWLLLLVREVISVDELASWYPSFRLFLRLSKLGLAIINSVYHYYIYTSSKLYTLRSGCGSCRVFRFPPPLTIG